MANLVNKLTSKAKRTFQRLFSRNASPSATSESIERSDGEDSMMADSPRSAPEHVERLSAAAVETPGRPPDVHITPESVSDEPPPTPSPGRQPRAEAGFPWLNSVKLALELFEKTLNSVPAPGLRGVIGGVLKIIERHDVSMLPYFKVYLSYPA